MSDMKNYKHIEHMRNLNDSLIWERMKRCYDYGYEDGKATTPFTDTEEAEKTAYEQEPCDDAVSRTDFEAHLFENYCVPVSKIGKPNQYSSGCFYKDVVKCLDDLPSVTQKLKTGHWIFDETLVNWRCSKCNETPKTMGYVGTADFMAEHFKFCNHCGAKMVEPQERSDKE